MRFLCVAQVVGRLLIVLAFIFLGPAIVAVYYGEETLAFFEAFGSTFVFGMLLKFIARNASMHFTAKEGFATVVFSWILLSIFGSLPYAYMDLGTDSFRFADAVFETISGFTTTGSSVMQHIEAMPKSLLLWRSLTQWIGGMGIIVLFLAILPMLGAGGFQLFRAEIPGPTKDKLSPKIKNTATYLWLIYMGLTLLLAILLYLTGDMDWFDSICHSFTTVSTGGYSTKDASIKAFNSWQVEVLIMIFMFVCSCNFGILILLIKAKYNQVYQNEELRFYVTIIAFLILVMTLQNAYVSEPNTSFLKSLRMTTFQVITLISSTGFSTADFDSWSSVCNVLIILMMIIGGCAGSTSGGLKVFRLLVMLKVGKKQIHQVIHPRGIFNIKTDGMVIEGGLISVILGFIILFFTFIIVSMFVLLVFEGDKWSFQSLFAVSISCISNIGPGMLEFGPTDNFSKFSDASKYWLSFLMLLGRLELYSILVFFHSDFWRK